MAQTLVFKKGNMTFESHATYLFHNFFRLNFLCSNTCVPKFDIKKTLTQGKY